MKKNQNLLDTIAILGMMNSWGDPRHSQFIKAMQPYVVEKKARKCLLPSCNILTKHNGGYCCGDHCREHDRIKIVKE
jgi:recombinational DNA repair protein RecR